MNNGKTNAARMTRKEFVAGLAAVAGTSALSAQDAPFAGMRGALLHFGTNMWQAGRHAEKLTFDESVWRKIVDRMVARKMNFVLIDLGEALVYPSHPEIAVKDSWTVERFRKELARLRSLGLEPLPKLNFSTGHNAWMGQWRFAVGTPAYSRTVRDLVKDAADIFDHPRLLHIGYDEETAEHQAKYDYCVVRRNGLWWRDFTDLVACVSDNGMRPWMWSDYGWRHPEFFEKCPKSVLQSNWYYRQWFKPEEIPTKDKTFNFITRRRLETFADLEKAGFDQIPCASNDNNPVNCALTYAHCRRVCDPRRLVGMMVASWRYCVPGDLDRNLAAIDQLGDALDAR